MPRILTYARSRHSKKSAGSTGYKKVLLYGKMSFQFKWFWWCRPIWETNPVHIFWCGYTGPPLCSAEERANAPGAAELSCRAPSGQLSLLIQSSCQSWQPLLNPLKGHLKVVWQGNVDNRETYVTPNGVLRKNTTSSCEAGVFRHIWNLHIFQKERVCRILYVNWMSLRKYFFLCIVHYKW